MNAKTGTLTTMQVILPLLQVPTQMLNYDELHALVVNLVSAAISQQGEIDALRRRLDEQEGDGK